MLLKHLNPPPSRLVPPKHYQYQSLPHGLTLSGRSKGLRSGECCINQPRLAVALNHSTHTHTTLHSTRTTQRQSHLPLSPARTGIHRAYSCQARKACSKLAEATSQDWHLQRLCIARTQGPFQNRDQQRIKMKTC